MIVVDTSAVIQRLIGWPIDKALAERLSRDPEWHAPHLLDVECVHTVRRLVRIGRLSVDRGTDVLLEIAELPIVRYPHQLLVERMWELRDNLSAYDAAYVALGEALDVPLVTTDMRLKKAPGHYAYVEVYPRSA